MSSVPQDRKQSHGISTLTVALLYGLGGCYVIIQSLQGECGQLHRPDMLNLLRPLEGITMQVSLRFETPSRSVL